MLISPSPKFIFFHVPKVAGISIREAFKDYYQEPEKFKIKRPPKKIKDKPNPLYEMWLAFLLHAKARDVHKELGPEVYNTYYKFAFVRNPWAWQVSMYHFILKETTHIRHELVKGLSGFDQYLEWVVHAKNPYPKGATKFQHEIITDEQGRLMVDFVGKYENLQEDFHHVCRVIGIKAHLPHLNQSSHRDYKSYYNKDTQRIIAKIFQADIDLFGYLF